MNEHKFEGKQYFLRQGRIISIYLKNSSLIHHNTCVYFGISIHKTSHYLNNAGGQQELWSLIISKACIMSIWFVINPTWFTIYLVYLQTSSHRKLHQDLKSQLDVHCPRHKLRHDLKKGMCYLIITCTILLLLSNSKEFSTQYQCSLIFSFLCIPSSSWLTYLRIHGLYAHHKSSDQLANMEMNYLKVHYLHF